LLFNALFHCERLPRFILATGLRGSQVKPCGILLCICRSAAPAWRRRSSLRTLAFSRTDRANDMPKHCTSRRSTARCRTPPPRAVTRLRIVDSIDARIAVERISAIGTGFNQPKIRLFRAGFAVSRRLECSGSQSRTPGTLLCAPRSKALAKAAALRSSPVSGAAASCLAASSSYDVSDRRLDSRQRSRRRSARVSLRRPANFSAQRPGREDVVLIYRALSGEPSGCRPLNRAD
jgi:hypothetical protein